MRSITSLVAMAFAFACVQMAHAAHNDYLVKLSAAGLKNKTQILEQFEVFEIGAAQMKTEDVTDQWIRIQNIKLSSDQMKTLSRNASIEYIQPNYRLKLINDFKGTQEQISKLQGMKFDSPIAIEDNPAIPAPVTPVFVGNDPLYNNQWGMIDNNVATAWTQAGTAPIVVAVIDTGVDYTHQDLVEMLWRNPFEIPNNNVDDDGNGYVDDLVGWDFVTNDNKPYDLTTDPMQMLFSGGNPGHGTHCAGNVGARAGNGKGIAGVAGVNNIRIMSIRFLSEKGQGTTADAVKSIRYAVDNGAHVLSNSWGSSGEDPNDPDNQALRDAIAYTQANGALFVAAAGNGDSQGKGYDNDTSSQPAYPASYPDDVIVSVAALDKNNNLGSFSNWGKNTVDIGAPGVVVYSTVPMNKYTDVALDLPQFGIKATWDGTSMATPHVAGAAALLWSKYPNANWKQIKDALLQTATPVGGLRSKTVSGGKLNVNALMNL